MTTKYANPVSNLYPHFVYAHVQHVVLTISNNINKFLPDTILTPQKNLLKSPSQHNNNNINNINQNTIIYHKRVKRREDSPIYFLQPIDNSTNYDFYDEEEDIEEEISDQELLSLGFPVPTVTSDEKESDITSSNNRGSQFHYGKFESPFIHFTSREYSIKLCQTHIRQV